MTSAFAATAAYGRGASGNWPCMRFSSLLSRSSSGTAEPSLRARTFPVTEAIGDVLRVVGDDEVGAGAA